MDCDNFFRKYPELFELFQLVKAEFQQMQRPPEQTILDDVDLREMLKVSQRTTAEWRAKRLITYSKIQGKIYYTLSDILDFISRYSIQDSSKFLRVKV